VSKTDLIRWLRCPYTWWLLERGEITLDDTLDEFQYRLIVAGNQFQDTVESKAEPIVVPPEQLPAMLTSGKKLLATPMFENRKLHIYGRPDGVDAADGALIPIEIKSHKNVLRTDELELAFYWMVLEPSRSRHVEPRGLLLLLRDGEEEEVEVAISLHRFVEVRRILSEIRTARREGVRPRVCGCHVCSTVRHDDVLKAVHQAEDVTLIYGVGRKYGPALEGMGIATWRGLESCDSRRVVRHMKKRGYFLSIMQVEWWKRHARSYATAVPVAFGEAPPLPSSYVALDLEYTPPHVWLIGIAIVEGERRRFRALWADGPVTLRKNLQELAAILQASSSLPILTWSGEGADLPNLASAIERLLPEPPRKGGGWIEPHPLVDPLWDRHRDVYLYVLRGLRLPIPQLGLKDVAQYFGIPRVSNVIDGLDAQMKYEEYRRTKGDEKKALRQELIAYNRDDLEALIEVTERVVELMKSAEPIVLPRTRRRRRSHRTVSRNGQAETPTGEAAWSRHLKSCDACLSAARGQDRYVSFCQVGRMLMESIGG
jgi:predicted RecB family nuclease